jgi:hypothetical protein
MAEGGWSSGTWGEAGWGMSVYYRDAAETATTSDSELVAGSVFLGAVDETAQGVDAVAPFHNFFSGVEDGASVSGTSEVSASTMGVSVSELTTAASTSAAQQDFAVAVNEQTNASEAVAAQQVFNSEISESSVGEDTLDAAFAYFANVDETITASETTETNINFVVPITESAAGSEVNSAQHVLDARVSEAAMASVQAVVSSAIFYVYVTTSATIADELTARFLWEPIDDNQDANWQNINDSQTPNWTEVQTA